MSHFIGHSSATDDELKMMSLRMFYEAHKHEKAHVNVTITTAANTATASLLQNEKRDHRRIFSRPRYHVDRGPPAPLWRLARSPNNDQF